MWYQTEGPTAYLFSFMQDLSHQNLGACPQRLNHMLTPQACHQSLTVSWYSLGKHRQVKKCTSPATENIWRPISPRADSAPSYLLKKTAAKKDDDLVNYLVVISCYIGGIMVYPPRNQCIGAIAGGLSLIPCPPSNLPGLRPRSFQASKSSDQQAAASPSKPCVIQNVTILFLDVFYLHRDVYTNDHIYLWYIYICIYI